MEPFLVGYIWTLLVLCEAWTPSFPVPPESHPLLFQNGDGLSVLWGRANGVFRMVWRAQAQEFRDVEPHIRFVFRRVQGAPLKMCRSRHPQGSVCRNQIQYQVCYHACQHFLRFWGYIQWSPPIPPQFGFGWTDWNWFHPTCLWWKHYSFGHIFGDQSAAENFGAPAGPGSCMLQCCRVLDDTFHH